MGNSIYCIHDNDSALKKKGAFPIKASEIKKFNDLDYGIFWTPNDFKGRRKAENLTRINYWLADLDDGTKQEQMDKIKSLPILPSQIVETKKGYHCYWKAINGSILNYREIAKGLIARLNADPACKDVCRLLRMPQYYHCKDKDNRFMVKMIKNNEKSFKESQMLLAYQLPKPKIKKLRYDGEKKDLIDEKNWEKIFRISQIGAGGRNNDFTRIYLWLRDEDFTKEVIFNVISRMNDKISEPLDGWEIKQIVRMR